MGLETVARQTGDLARLWGWPDPGVPDPERADHLRVLAAHHQPHQAADPARAEDRHRPARGADPGQVARRDRPARGLLQPDDRRVEGEHRRQGAGSQRAAGAEPHPGGPRPGPDPRPRGAQPGAPALARRRARHGGGEPGGGVVSPPHGGPRHDHEPGRSVLRRRCLRHLRDGPRAGPAARARVLELAGWLRGGPRARAAGGAGWLSGRSHPAGDAAGTRAPGPGYGRRFPRGARSPSGRGLPRAARRPHGEPRDLPGDGRLSATAGPPGRAHRRAPHHPGQPVQGRHRQRPALPRARGEEPAARRRPAATSQTSSPTSATSSALR